MRKVTNKDGFGRPRIDYQTVNTDPSETIQSDAHLTSVEHILRQFGEFGNEALDVTEMTFMDVSDFGDYHDVMLEVRRAETEFLKLPAQVRAIFGNSVEQWLDTAHDQDKRDELVAAGFITVKESSPATKPPGIKGGVKTAPAETGDGETGEAADPPTKTAAPILGAE